MKLLDGYTPQYFRTGLEPVLQVFREVKPDAFVTMNFPFSLHAYGLLLKQRLGVPWLVEFRDPWVKNTNHFSGQAGCLHQALERKVLEAADRAVFHEGVQMEYEYFEETYPNLLERIHKLPHPGYFQKEYQIQRKTFDEFTITYAGSFYEPAQTPVNFLKGLVKLFQEERIQRNDVRVNFLGDWNSSWNELVTSSNLENVVYRYGWVQKKEAIRIMKGSDVLLYINRQYDGDELNVSIKFGDYLGARKPILVLGKKGAKSINWIRKYNFGLWADYDSIRGIKEALKTAYEQPLEKLFCPDKKTMHSFSRTNNIERYCAVLDQMTSTEA